MVIRGQPPEPLFREWSSLTSFSRLERLILLDIHPVGSSFITTLRQMRHLSELEIFSCPMSSDLVPIDFITTVFSLTQLKSLVLEPYTGCTLPVPSGTTESITAMQQLTRLVLPIPLCGRSLRQLTEMIDLQISGLENVTPGFLNDLTSMRNLTSLKIHTGFAFFNFPSSILQQLKKLKTFTLWKMDVHSDLKTAMTLPDLTELGVIRQCCLTNGNRYFSDQTPFSNLRTLAVECEWPIKEIQIHIPKRCMPKVQRIKFLLKKHICEQRWRLIMRSLENSLKWPDLIHMFPCLRHVSFVLADMYGRPFEEHRLFSSIDLS